MIHRASDDRKEQVRRATDVVTLVQRYLPLRRSGRSFSACCPFHQERTPSFHVWPESQRWKCFSCNKSGDVFTFVMEKEGVDFPEALRMLAREAGIALEPADPAAAGAARAKDAAYAAAEWACRWFQGNLKGSPGADYLRGRGVAGETALQWRLGYAPDAWDGLLSAARRDRVPAESLEAAGLVLRRRDGTGTYDAFRHRVLFPIADPRGRVVGFGARTLGDEEPKYLNTPETILFRKGGLLFGLDRARDEASRTRTLAVMEGYMDALMAHQHGIRNAVAGLGTAFTPDHAALMRRYADRVLLVYDADPAGRRAADRALGVLLEADLDARVAVIEGGKDPCDLLVAHGPAPLREALEGAREVFEHLLAETAARHDLATVSGRAAAADEMLRAVARVPNGVKRSLMVGRVGGMFGFSEAEIRRRASALASPPAAPRAGTPAAPAAPAAAPPSGSQRERKLLEAALVGPGLAARLAAEAPPATFATPSLARIARAVIETAAGGTGDPAACAASLADDVLADEVSVLAAAGACWPADALRRQFEDCLRTHTVQRRIQEAWRLHSEALARGDAAAVDLQAREIQRLEKQRAAPGR